MKHVKFIEFKNRHTKLSIVLGIHNKMSIHEQADGSVIFNDNEVARSYYPDETYADFVHRFMVAITS